MDLPLGTATLAPPDVSTVTVPPALFVTEYSLAMPVTVAGTRTVAVCTLVSEPVITSVMFRASEDVPSAIVGSVVVPPEVTATSTEPATA
jgi:hypothetical protein